MTRPEGAGPVAVVETAARLRRLLAILAWLSQVGEAPIVETAARFDLTPQALVTELEMAACCGVPPYTPDQLMEIVVTDATVSVRVGTALTRPRRLSPSEGFALAASARALLAVGGSDENGALSRALAKLDRALGGDQIQVELDAPEFLPLVREAVASGARLAISYYSASTDRESEREITPTRLFATEGHWYVDAWCSTAGDVRRFRVDRIGVAHIADRGPAPAAAPTPEAVEAAPPRAAPVPGGEGDESAGRLTGLDSFVPGPESRQVRLSLDPSAVWLVESIPSAGPLVEVAGRVELSLFVGGDAWLERLLLRLGPDARVIEPAELRGLAASAARRVLARYSGAGPDGRD